MDITTSLAAPSSTFMTILGIIAKVLILVYIYIVSSNLASLASNSDNSNGRNGNAIEEVLHHFWNPLSALAIMMKEKIKFDTDFGLPRMVAAALTYHIGFCCLFVGMVHLRVIKAR